MMTVVIVFASLLFQTAGIWFLRDGNAFTSTASKQFLACILFVISCVMLSTVFGVLGGIIVSVAAVSLIGMLMPMLVSRRLQSNDLKQNVMD
ncbi:hypothetical protein [Alteromonas oceanisediminis]|uniref:hypothetical protein n=1 Tax=Alteromonas oceanisediminis TaxID=2836180 RepID=UPI001BDB4C7E|nr:hypothetical protein [Alteromonas oceanisediminis]MBT0585979.1 hypothetical protein [Alteromonas oceanisediminis]